MSLVWVRAGQCGRETRTEALRRLDVGREISANLLDTEVYRTVGKFECRNSCVVPAAVLKAQEVEADIFAAAESQIAFADCGSSRG